MAKNDLLRKRYVDPPADDEQPKDEPTGEFSSLGYVDSYEKEQGTPPENYPEICVSADQLPDIEKHEVGDEITLVVKATITGHKLDDGGQGGAARYHLDLTSAKIKAGE